MKRSIVLAGLLFAPAANAELTKLGDYSLGQSLAKSVFVKSATVLGCTGSLRQEIEKGKVSAIEFTPDGKCDKRALEAAIEKDYGAKPIASVDKKTRLWEGKTGAAIVLQGMSGDVRVRVVAAGLGTKRVCFADDGFAAFWKSFKDNLGKADAAAAMFKFPLKDFDDKVVAKDAKALAKKWPKLIDDDDKTEIASGKLTPVCEFTTDNYSLRLGNSNVSFEAKQVGGKWMWVEINDVAGG